MDNNNQDIKLCPSCGARNKAIYKYCNECGAALNQSDYKAPGASTAPPVYSNPSQNSNNENNQGESYGQSYTYYNGQFGQGGYTPYPPYGTTNAPYYGTPDFDGVSAKDVYEYADCRDKLFYKLRTQHFSGRTGPYCWPLFVLGLLLGFFGMGCWYLYHKMYKPAVGFFAAALAELALKIYTVYIVLKVALDVATNENISNFSNYDSSQLEEYIMGLDYGLFGFLNSLTSLISLGVLALAIVLPFFAYKQYKNHILKKIRVEYEKSPMPNIPAIGGLNTGLVVTASVSYAIISIVAASLLIGWLFDVAFKLAEKIETDGSYYEEYYELPYGDEGLDFNDDSGDIW